MGDTSTTFPPPPALSRTAARMDHHSAMAASTTSGGSSSPGAMRKQHRHVVQTPLPRHLPPQEVVAALQSHVAVLKHHALVTHFERATAAPAYTADPFFHGGSPIAYPSDGGDGDGGVGDGGARDARLTVYNVYQRIPLIPGIASKEINFPVTFQDLPDGIRCRADAPAGVIVWSEYMVRAKPPDSEGSAVAAAGSGPAAAAGGWEAEVDRQREYELVKWVTVETNSLLMPFVARTMEDAHREICRKVLDDVAVRFSWD